MTAGRDEAGAGLDRLTGFARALRAAGLAVGARRTLAFVQAADALGPEGADDLYWAGRLTLVGRRAELPIYDRVFAEWFAGARPRIDRRRMAGLRIRVEGELPGDSFRDPGRMRETVEPAGGVAFSAASPTEVLRRKSFEDYTAEDRARVRAMIDRLARREPVRRSRRTRPGRRRGIRPDLPRTLRQALRTGGEPMGLAWRRRRTRPRRLALVLDVSGSMGAYARSLAAFAHAAVQGGRREVEAFAFGTRLTRITPALHSHDPDAALDALGDTVPDWEGGTRIGASLKDLVDRWGRRWPLRGAIVVILSDGLERDEPDLLAAQMERLGRLAYRVNFGSTR